jgi:hypothetical protein
MPRQYHGKHGPEPDRSDAGAVCRGVLVPIRVRLLPGQLKVDRVQHFRDKAHYPWQRQRPRSLEGVNGSQPPCQGCLLLATMAAAKPGGRSFLATWTEAFLPRRKILANSLDKRNRHPRKRPLDRLSSWCNGVHRRQACLSLAVGPFWQPDLSLCVPNSKKRFDPTGENSNMKASHARDCL